MFGGNLTEPLRVAERQIHDALFVSLGRLDHLTGFAARAGYDIVRVAVRLVDDAARISTRAGHITKRIGRLGGRGDGFDVDTRDQNAGPKVVQPFLSRAANLFLQTVLSRL